MNTDKSVRLPFAVYAPSGFGTLPRKQAQFCRDSVGRKRSTWDFDNYMWHSIFYFKNEADATMFRLKWAL